MFILAQNIFIKLLIICSCAQAFATFTSGRFRFYMMAEKSTTSGLKAPF